MGGWAKENSETSDKNGRTGAVAFLPLSVDRLAVSLERVRIFVQFWGAVSFSVLILARFVRRSDGKSTPENNEISVRHPDNVANGRTPPVCDGE